MHEDLLLQAEQLASLDARKPRQVNLRRAVSAAYYALFHALVHEACCLQFGTQHAQSKYRQVIGRAFNHTVMKQACASFGGGMLKATVRKGLPTAFAIPPEIRNIALTFVEFQEKRHLADYDLTERFQRSEVRELVRNARLRITQFRALPASDHKSFFLACLWAWKDLANR